jgi:hypothetical protein
MLITVVLALRDFDPGKAFLSFSESTLINGSGKVLLALPSLSGSKPKPDASYAKTLLEQAALASACDSYYAKNGRAPTSVSELIHSSVAVNTQPIDPWGRSYLVRSLGESPCLVQSTGRSGNDEIQELDKKWAARSKENHAFFVNDNLIVVGQAIGHK